MVTQAVFSLEHYLFDKVYINLENYNTNEFRIEFEPSGVFHKDEKVFKLNFSFSATCDEMIDSFVSINCLADFQFKDVNKLEDIPPYFYRNCIAILFPFLRGFVSMVTIQANVPPILLPTMNLTSLEKPLTDNTSEK